MSETEEQEPLRPPRARTPKDDLFDSLTEHFGVPRTRTEEVMFGKVVSELLHAGATKEEADNACSYVLRNFDSPSVFSVAKWFTAAQNEKPKMSRQEEEVAKLRSVQ